jgi:NADH:ubiquinone oxidoreductase subunit E
MDTERILEIVNQHTGERGALISILEDVQSTYGYLPGEALRCVAERTGRSLVDVYGVATFYRAFSLEPRGKHLCTVCVGTACHVRGAPTIVEAFQTELGVDPGQTTPDKEFTLLTVNCLGACALGPIVVLDGQYFSNVSTTRVPDVVEQGRLGIRAEDLARDERLFPIDVACPRCNHGLMDPDHPIGGHPSIRVLMTAGRGTGWLRLSGLYGLWAWEGDGGAGEGDVVRLFCPHCQGALGGVSPCPDCGAPFVPLLVREGAILRVCSRLGCRGHALDLSGVNA